MLNQNQCSRYDTIKSMIKNWIIVLPIVLLIGVGGYLYATSSSTPSFTGEKLDTRKTEGIECSTTVPSHCSLYRCKSGYILENDIPTEPGGGRPGFECTDGWSEWVKDVPTPAN